MQVLHWLNNISNFGIVPLRVPKDRQHFLTAIQNLRISQKIIYAYIIPYEEMPINQAKTLTQS